MKNLNVWNKPQQITDIWDSKKPFEIRSWIAVNHNFEKIKIFKNRLAKNLKIFGVKLGHFAMPLRHNHSPYDVV